MPIPSVPAFDSKRVVDGQRKIEFLKPLPVTSAGRKFEVRSKVVGVYDKGKAGSVVETSTELVEKGGEVYSRAVGSGFFVGQGGWGGPKGRWLFRFGFRICIRLLGGAGGWEGKAGGEKREEGL